MAEPALPAPVEIRHVATPASVSTIQGAIWRRLGLVGYLVPFAWPLLAFAGLLAGHTIVSEQVRAGAFPPVLAEEWRAGFSVGAFVIFVAYAAACVFPHPLQKRLVWSEQHWLYRLGAEGLWSEREDGHETGMTRWPGIEEIRQTRAATVLFVARNRAFVIPHAELPDGLDRAEFIRHIEAWRAAAEETA
ncbi:MAG: YcxB family protein [Pseudomonadota bacterium]